MTVNIVVCVKQTPAPAEARLDEATKTRYGRVCPWS